MLKTSYSGMVFFIVFVLSATVLASEKLVSFPHQNLLLNQETCLACHLKLSPNGFLSEANFGAMDMASVVCVTCHDGVIARGNYVEVFPENIAFWEHTIGFPYPDSAEYASTKALEEDYGIVFSGKEEGLSCISCHSVHSDLPQSLRVRGKYPHADICVTCHKNTAHQEFTARMVSQRRGLDAEVDTFFEELESGL